jgi:hypothetical protein
MRAVIWIGMGYEQRQHWRGEDREKVGSSKLGVREAEEEEEIELAIVKDKNAIP